MHLDAQAHFQRLSGEAEAFAAAFSLDSQKGTCGIVFRNARPKFTAWLRQDPKLEHVPKLR